MSVQQETEVSERPFKNVVQNNLKWVASACFDANKPMKLEQSMFGLVVYGHGGTCLVFGITCWNTV
jgi:hypothetical protein